MNATIVLQARTSSSRLPGKVLLPLGGMPLAVLAAKRAANRGHRVIVATSTERDDDELARYIEINGIELFRGSLTDVLGRFVGAISDCADDAPIVRLTADNVFPDGNLIADIENAFCEAGVDYLSCNSEYSGFPYGVSAEVMRAGALRRAAICATDPRDREHVTPWIARHASTANFVPKLPVNMANFRCTIDVLDDYLLATRIFRNVDDPVRVALSDLLTCLVVSVEKPLVVRPVQKLVLGTAQLGMEYGIANATGRPADAEACELIQTAIRNGVRALDTARAYGTSEAVVGKSLRGGWRERVKLLTKLEPHLTALPGADYGVIANDVEFQVLRSCRELGTESLDVVMLHRAEHLTAHDGAIWQSLKDLRDRGLIGALGVSIQSPEELRSVLEYDDVAHLQLPFNVLDNRWRSEIPKIVAAKAERNIQVHARSALLQGLLVSRNQEHWSRAGVTEPEVVWKWLDRLVQSFGRHDSADLALAFVRSQPWVDGVVVGIETIDQLERNIATFDRPPLTDEQCLELERTRVKLGEQVLNPSRWLPSA
ncbi:aldo/keto reductase [Pelagerythrobacter rhizovicinus]|uniref:NADP-dependent oxidoreductase domain-containing protein n=1 Tax=Pelagerythrobacter rhizovicinus TaxID=2268576 RepID=A0A4Q2KMK7_9SPHN|nr:aldo/keto reductase [Pelagerythrobacter rhizovicinus]RXZ64752.1 hypothetical protein ETX26_12860 [Pelagerythrobacter rhizovicinus]